MNVKRCDRCGIEKKPPRDTTTQLCQECEACTTCVHYADHPPGLLPKDWKCTAGINVYELCGAGSGTMLRMPCRYFRKRNDADVVQCKRFKSTPIEDVIAQDKAWIEFLEKSKAAMEKVNEIREQHKGESWHGEIECPMGCGGTLHLSISGYNGHMHGRCTTDGCLAWIE